VAERGDEEGHEWKYTIKPAAINCPSNIQSVSQAVRNTFHVG